MLYVKSKEIGYECSVCGRRTYDRVWQINIGGTNIAVWICPECVFECNDGLSIYFSSSPPPPSDSNDLNTDQSPPMKNDPTVSE
mgnify:CR=1 FL=1